MNVHLYLAPAGWGKTAYVLREAREAARGLRCEPRICVPTFLQREACRRRLADLGGAIGVRVGTFDQIYSECLDTTRQTYTLLSEPVQYRLVRSLLDRVDLSYYAPLRARPGFAQSLQALFAEWKAARVLPDVLLQAVSAGGEARLIELARLYLAYQDALQANRWADRAGIGWLAAEALEVAPAQTLAHWPLLFVDGFDSLTEVQLAVVTQLAQRVDKLVITLTGDAQAPLRPAVHDRFGLTRQRLEATLGVAAEPLPDSSSHARPALQHLERRLFRAESSLLEQQGQVESVEAPDRASEVRAALRWIKERIVLDGVQPNQTALLARHTEAYRVDALQVAREFGLPLRVAGGMPLDANPAVQALLNLLQLVLPRSNSDPQFAMPRRLVIEAWRSPYFDWSDARSADGAAPVGIQPGDAETLDAVARAGAVMAGLDQWQQTLSRVAGAREQNGDDEEPGLAERLPSQDRMEGLPIKFRRFVERIAPPAGSRSCREWVAWLEDLIGPDPQVDGVPYGQPERSEVLRSVQGDGSLGMVVRARSTGDQPALRPIAEMDVAAMQALKDVARGLVWAEAAVSPTLPVDFRSFFTDLVGAIQATRYRLPAPSQRQEVLLADVAESRGLPFRAVALVGLAEGEFPARVQEDPFLREDDRERLRTEHGLPIPSSLTTSEAEYFYEALARPTERLLLVRPRLAENGAIWEASPYWEEVGRWLTVEPRVLRSQGTPELGEVSSVPELMMSLAVQEDDTGSWTRSVERHAERTAALKQARNILGVRSGAGPDPYSGDLASERSELSSAYCPQAPWSITRLETYRNCPFEFFARYVLGLEPKTEPQEGPDGRQLGNIYHRLMAALYETVPDGPDPLLSRLMAALPAVARRILDNAPDREGFRATAWWAQTCREITDNVQHALDGLHAEEATLWVPLCQERYFDKQEALVIRAGGDWFSVRGTIDRIDRRAGGELRVIDYKTGGSGDYTLKSVREGRKMQVPLYALAAKESLGLGTPVEGYYWHMNAGKSSTFRLSTFKAETGESGPEVAISVAREKAWAAVLGVRSGCFAPQPPREGCPGYCPMAGTCWRYRPKFRGA